MIETSSSGTRCKNPDCKRAVAQTGSGHRKREYCDDACRQAARRQRVEQAHREEVARRWATFTVETRGFLDWLTTRYSYGKDLADSVELAINREIDRYSAESSAQREPPLAALREKQLSRVEKTESAHSPAGARSGTAAASCGPLGGAGARTRPAAWLPR